MTWLQSTRGTFLAWHEPDALSLARQIAADTLRIADLPKAQAGGNRPDASSATAPVVAGSIASGAAISQVEALLPRHVHAVTARGLILKTLCFFLVTAFKAFV